SPTLGEPPGDPPMSLESSSLFVQISCQAPDLTFAFTFRQLYVKGVVNQEEQHEMPYPEVLHCVFAGARGLFMDCLIKITSAHITVGSPGFLLISGLAEPVVQAYSLIMDLVERFEASQKKHNEAALSATAESLDSRRSFKALVEHWEDRHTLNLLVLPASVKEALLELVKESGLENRRNSSGRGEFNENQDKTEADLMHPELRRLSMRDHKDPRTPDALLEVNGPSLGNRGIEDEDPDSSAQEQRGEPDPAKRRTRSRASVHRVRGGQWQDWIGREGFRSGRGGEGGCHLWLHRGAGEGASSQSHPGSSGGAGRNTQTLPGSGQAQSHRQDSRTPVRGPPQATYPVSEGPSTGRGQRRPFRPLPAASSITGAQRFVEGLQVPFELKLTDDPGDPGLRQVIIDASNVAMSHGLGHFFSCRGIALAVQYFWNRGHRKIAALVPQWREKKDPKNKEQHYITQLKDLGLLSFTPSREVMGKRINAYDDRFMPASTFLQFLVCLKMNKLLWFNLSRLLQYTFVGDLFMVPDDPLGRSGPHLDIFLASPAASQASLGHPAAPRAHTAERGVAESSRLKRGLLQVFPGQESVVMLALQCNPTATDVGQLSNYILELQGSDGSL
uniref:Uncharacterized protein n=1 Tax=Denticeps clupeoides TaxID=299321 RepID=A0AAY4DJT7_9TELE